MFLLNISYFLVGKLFMIFYLTFMQSRNEKPACNKAGLM